MADNQIDVRFSADYSELRDGAQAAANAVNSAVGDMTSSTDQLADDTASSLGRMAESFSMLQETIKGVLEILGAGELAKSMKEFVESGAEAGEKLQNIALSTGIGVEALSRLQYAAEVTGVSFDRVAVAVRQMDLKLEQFRSGQTNKAFQFAIGDLGLKPSDLADPAVAFDKMADALQRIGDNKRFIGDLSEIFGRAGASLVPLLAQLRELQDESDKTHFTASKDIVEGSDAAKESINRLDAAWEAAKMRLASALHIPIEEATGELQKFALAVNELSSNPKFIEFIDNATTGFINLADKIADATSRLAHFISQHHALGAIGGIGAEVGGGTLAMAGVATMATGAGLIPGAAMLAAGGLTGLGGLALQKGLAPPSMTGAVPGAQGAAGKLQELLASKGPEEPLNSPLNLIGQGEGGGISAPAKSNKDVLNQQLADFVAEQRLELAEANTTADAEAQAKIAMLQKVADEALRLSDLANDPREAHKLVDAARMANAEELQERIKYIDQLKKLDAEEIASEAKDQMGLLDIQKSQLALGLAAAQAAGTEKDALKVQELQAEQELADKKYAIQLNAIAQQRALYDQGTTDYAKYTAQITTTAEKWKEEQLKLATDIATAQQEAANKVMEAWQQALQPVTSSLNSMIDALLKGQSPLATLEKTAGGAITGLIHGAVGTVVGGGGQDTIPGALSSELFGERGGISGLIASKLGVSPAGELGKAFGLSPTGQGSEGILQVAATTFQAAVAQFAAAVGIKSAAGVSGDIPTGSLMDSLTSSPDASTIYGILAGSPDASTIAGVLASSPDASTVAGFLAGAPLPAATGTSAAPAVSGASPAAGGPSISGALGSASTLATNIASGKPLISDLGPAEGLANDALGLFGTSVGGVASSAAGGIGDAISAIAPLALSFLGFEHGGIVSAAGGALMGSGATPAILHPKEMVLPADISQKVQNMTGGGDTHHHYNTTMNVSAIDSDSFRGTLGKHMDVVTNHLQRMVRNSDPRVTGRK